jgi:hypothetical protein
MLAVKERVSIVSTSSDDSADALSGAAGDPPLT